MNETLPAVRLSKDGSRAVCAKIACGFTFAEVLKEKPMVGLDFLGGWARRGDGVWRMSPRAYTNLREGRGPRVRRAPNPSDNKPGRGKVRERSYRPESVFNRMFAELPVEVICPACETRQIALQGALMVP
jgi:hypothetical protein